MDDIRKFIKIMEGTIDQTFDNDNVDKHDKIVKRLSKDFDSMFKDRKKKKDNDKEDVKEGPFTNAIKTGILGVLLSFTGGVKADPKDVMGTAMTAIQNIQNTPEEQKKIINRELIRSAQASIGNYRGYFAYIYLDSEEKRVHDEIVKLGIQKPFANIIMMSLIKAEMGDNYMEHPALGYGERK